MPENRKKTGQFQKGMSGNPGGRPKGSYVDTCKEWAESKGWNRLIAWAEGKDGATAQMRVEAAKTLLAYGYGKPRQSVELGGNTEGPLTVQIVSYAGCSK